MKHGPGAGEVVRGTAAASATGSWNWESERRARAMKERIVVGWMDEKTTRRRAVFFASGGIFLKI